MMQRIGSRFMARSLCRTSRRRMNVRWFSGEHKAASGTTFIHAGQDPDPISGAVTTPISLATTFVQESPGNHTGFEYSRTGNPTRQSFEQQIAAAEGGKYGLAFASGSATTGTIVHLLNSGDHVISIDDVYGGTNRYFNQVAAPCNGMQFSMVDMSEGASALDAAKTDRTKMVWVETPTNPTLKLVDIAAIGDWCKQNDCIFVVDNTFMSPYLQSPLDLGADIVMHSVTKYIGGHSDTVMGVVATNDTDIYERLKFLQNSLGAVPAPFDCYMAQRGLKTLHVRMDRHCENAQAVAEYLEAHPKVESVVYPGLASHPQHELAKKQARGFGGMITFFLQGGLKESRVFLETLDMFALAESLGAVESLAEHPAIMTHASVPPEQREQLGIHDNLIRLSVGIEQVEDIIADLDKALAAV